MKEAQGSLNGIRYWPRHTVASIP